MLPWRVSAGSCAGGGGQRVDAEGVGEGVFDVEGAVAVGGGAAAGGEVQLGGPEGEVEQRAGGEFHFVQPCAVLAGAEAAVFAVAPAEDGIAGVVRASGQDTCVAWELGTEIMPARRGSGSACKWTGYLRRFTSVLARNVFLTPCGFRQPGKYTAHENATVCRRDHVRIAVCRGILFRKNEL